MGNHRRSGRAQRRQRHAAFLAGTMLLTGMVALMTAVARADLTPARFAVGPPPASAAPVEATGPAGGAPDVAAPSRPIVGSWAGSLVDPDTATVEVRLTVEGEGRGLRVDVPALRCSYRGPDPVPAGGPGRAATAEVRAEGERGPGCVEAARIRLGADDAAGPVDRVRYDLVASCDAATCAPRRAQGVLTAR